MADKSKIEWTDATWNPTTGCNKISAGCKNCYAKRDWARLSKNPATVYYGREFEDVRTHPDRLGEPLKWKRSRRIFVNSMSDLFHESIPFEFIGAVFGVMMATKQHNYQVLTKRPERAEHFFRWLSAGVILSGQTHQELIEEYALQHVDACHLQADISQWPLPNVWIGVSVENQEEADQRIPALLKIPAAVRFLSCEPLLGPIDFTAVGYPHPLLRWHCRNCDARVISATCPVCGYASERIGAIDWLIVGGESGPNARPMQREWVDSLIAQCRAAGVPAFVKQLGAAFSDSENGIIGHSLKVPAEAVPLIFRRLNDSKGGNLTEWPAALRIRQFPEVSR